MSERGPVGGAGELTHVEVRQALLIAGKTPEHAPMLTNELNGILAHKRKGNFESWYAQRFPNGFEMDKAYLQEAWMAALVAKAPQGVPPVEAEAVNSTKGNNLVGFNVKVFGVDFGFHGSETPLGRVLAASRLPVPAPVSATLPECVHPPCSMPLTCQDSNYCMC